MPRNIGEAQVVVTADTSAFRRAMAKLNPTVNANVKVGDGLDKNLLKGSAAAKLFNRQTNELIASGKKVGQSFNGLSPVTQALLGAVRAGGSFAAALNRLGLANVPLGQLLTKVTGISVAFKAFAPVLEAAALASSGLGVAAGGAVAGLNAEVVAAGQVTKSNIGIITSSNAAAASLDLLGGAASSVGGANLAGAKTFGNLAASTGKTAKATLETSGALRKVGEAGKDVNRVLITTGQVATKTGEQIAQAGSDSGSLTKAFSALTGQSVGMIAAFAAIAIGVAAYIKTLKVGVKETLEAEKSFASIRALLGGLGSSAGTTSDDIAKLADGIAQLTGVADEEVASTAALGLSFARINNVAGEGGDIFDQYVKSSVGLAAKFKVELPQASKVLGKALADPIKGIAALQKLTRSFTVTQIDSIKQLEAQGKHVEAQKKILAGLGDTYAVAVAQGETLEGQQNRLRETFQAFAQEAAEPLIPAFKDMVIGARELFEGFEDLLEPFGGLKNITEGLAHTLTGIGQTLSFFGGTLSKVGKALLGTKKDLHVAGEALSEYIAIIKSAVNPFALIFRSIGQLHGAITGNNKATEDGTKATIDAAEAARLAAAEQDRYTESIDEYNEERRKVLDAEEAWRRANVSVQKALDDSAEAQEEYNHVLHGFPAESKEAIKATDEFEKAQLSLQEALLGVPEAELKQAEAARTLEEAQKKANGVLHGFAADSKEAIEATENLKDEILKQRDANLDLKESLSKTEDAERKLQRAQKIQAIVASAYSKNATAVALANRKVRDAQNESERAALDHDEAVNAVGDSERDVAEARRVAEGTLHGFTAESKEAKDATAELAKAELDVKQAAIDFAQAQLSVKEKTHELNEKLREQTGVLHGFPASSEEAKKAAEKLATAQEAIVTSTFDAKKAEEEMLSVQNEFGASLGTSADNAERLATGLERAGAALGKIGKTKIGGSGGGGGGGAFDVMGEGGPLRKGQAAIVGDKGPEIFVPASAGRIIPNRSIASSTHRTDIESPGMAKLASVLAGHQELLRALLRRTQINIVSVDGRNLAQATSRHQRRISRERS